jgi:DNA-binding NtrC family response regulator
MAGSVFVVDDQKEVIALLSGLLQKHGKTVHGFLDGEKALEALEKDPSDAELMVLDLDLGPGKRDGFFVLEKLRELAPDLPVIILTGKGTVEDAVRAMRMGATDFIEKDPSMGQRFDLHLVKLDRMLAVLEKNKRLERQNFILKERAGHLNELVGLDRGLRTVMEKVRALADIPRPVLILGERGTGKELVAAALHNLGRRSKGPFITINCAAVPETLAEAELFGHERGAFTDAHAKRPGKFELADQGTLFLDEIGNMPQPVQQKVLRAIEYQTFERVRGHETIRVDVRVTAATNANLEEEMKAGRFRRDLFDRLAFDTILVPPLRDRKGDIPALARAFIRRFKEEVPWIRCRDISEEALGLLQNLPFPGNVRELKNIIERAAFHCQGEEISVEDLDVRVNRPEPAHFAGALKDQVKAFERNVVQVALAGTQNNLAEAAKKLGLSYDALRRLLKKHGLRAGRDNLT